MLNKIEPLISANRRLPEITLRAILLTIILAIVLAASNTFLALKIGILTSASIPAAVISMGILKFFRNSNIFENNLVQTGASAGEAIAGGIVYTIPALVIIGYWNHFNYFENFAIALCGGILGVMFSIPLRRTLMNAQHLNFPEGRAIAELLRLGTQQALGLREMLLGGAVGGLIELAQTGFKIIASEAQTWFTLGRTMLGFGAGFSATLIGAGYLIGFNVAISILIGAVIAWGIGVPVLSTLAGNVVDIHQTAANLYGEKIHYIGIGAMLVAGFWTLISLLRPFYQSITISFQIFLAKNLPPPIKLRTDQDIPLPYVLLVIAMTAILIYFLLQYLFRLNDFGSANLTIGLVGGSLTYVLIIGFIFTAICGYFSGLVGVSASPGSSVVIAGMLLAALILRTVLTYHGEILSQIQLVNAAAMAIIIGGLVTGAAAIANDNIQDLKVGHIIGATPWKQQIMLILGVVVAAAIIPPIMELLFNVYGIGRVMPHSGMDPTQTLPAPPAAMMAALTQGVFDHDLPWNMLGAGAIIILICIVINKLIEQRNFSFSTLAIAIGIYLPLSSSIPLFLGGLFAFITKHRLQKTNIEQDTSNKKAQRGVMLASGLVSGAALMDILLAIPMALANSPNALNLFPASWAPVATLLGFLTVLGLGFSFYQVVCRGKN